MCTYTFSHPLLSLPFALLETRDLSLSYTHASFPALITSLSSKTFPLNPFPLNPFLPFLFQVELSDADDDEAEEEAGGKSKTSNEDPKQWLLDILQVSHTWKRSLPLPHSFLPSPTLSLTLTPSFRLFFFFFFSPPPTLPGRGDSHHRG